MFDFSKIRRIKICIYAGEEFIVCTQDTNVPERERDPLLGGKKVDKSDLRPFEAPSHHDDAAMQRIQRSTRIHIEMRAFT